MAWSIPCVVLLLVAELLITECQEPNGMKFQQFEGIPNIREVSCSGEDFLQPDVSVFAISLLDDSRQLLAQVNVMNKECTTSGTFSSCLLYNGNSRKTMLRSLVADLGEEEKRSYHCDVTFLKSGAKTSILHWRIDVKGLRV